MIALLNSRLFIRLKTFLRRDQAQMGSGVDTTLLLCLSAWVIVNSHLEQFYPYHWLAADGLLGNTLFFFLSGFGVQCSLRRRRQDFIQFLVRRLLRLYPSIIIASSLYLFLGLRPAIDASLVDIIAYFIWPSPYTYVKLIVFFYLALWIFDRGSTAVLYASLFLGVMVFVFSYNQTISIQGSTGRLVLGSLPTWQYVAFFWISTGCGALIARQGALSHFSWLKLTAIFLILVFYLCIKLLIVVLGIAIWTYPALFLIALLLSWLAFSTFCTPNFVERLLRIPLIGSFIAISGALTLQLYVVHEPLSTSQTLAQILFPANLFAIAIVTLIGSIFLKISSDSLIDFSKLWHRTSSFKD